MLENSEEILNYLYKVSNKDIRISKADINGLVLVDNKLIIYCEEPNELISDIPFWDNIQKAIEEKYGYTLCCGLQK